MNLNEFSKLIKHKNSRALLNLYDKFRNTINREVNPEFSRAIENELAKRELTEDDENYYHALIAGKKVGDTSDEFSDQELEGIMTSEWAGSATKRNEILKSLSRFIRVLTYILMTLGALRFLYFIDAKLLLPAANTLIGTLVFGTLLLTFSKLIHVLIDIEYNTRKQHAE